MTGRARLCQPGLPRVPAGSKMGMMADKKKERAERLAAALRENLKRRKAQARELNKSASAPAKAGAQPGEADKR